VSEFPHAAKEPFAVCSLGRAQQPSLKLETKMRYREMTLGLKRIDKKKWQYADCHPTRVELAALDYLRAEGWRGYFSEYFDFDHTLLVMMCFCNHDWYIYGKAEPRDFDMPHGRTPDLPIRTIDDAFLHARDGYWDFDEHHLYYRDLIENARSFDERKISLILGLWQERRVKSSFVGMAGYSPRDARELHEEDLISYFRARGGIDYFLDLIDSRYPARRQELLGRTRRLAAQLVESDDFEQEGGVRELIQEAGYYLGVLRSAREMPAVDTWIEEISSQRETALASEALNLSQDIGKYTAEFGSRADVRSIGAVLDLVIWKDSVACVEVKSPNDKLKPHQISQLIKDMEGGRNSWVINVVED